MAYQIVNNDMTVQAKVNVKVMVISQGYGRVQGRVHIANTFVSRLSYE